MLSRVVIKRGFSVSYTSRAAAADPVQKLFIEKIKEFKSQNKGLDAEHQRLMTDEMARLMRVYQIEDEKKLAHIDAKFPAEHQVSLRDWEEQREFRRQLASGALIQEAKAEQSKLLASIPKQVTKDMSLPPLNKPDVKVFGELTTAYPKPPPKPTFKYDYEMKMEEFTPEKLEAKLGVMFGKDMPTIHDDSKPGRDAVNFPREKPPLYNPPTRFHAVPESWFSLFYPKTGVTGPFVFASSFTTFLLSKEWLVWEHELLTVITSTFIFGVALSKFGPRTYDWMTNDTKKRDDAWDAWQKGYVDLLSDLQTHYRDEIGKEGTIKESHAIRREDVNVQLEHEYRRRVMKVYNEAKRRLNYTVAVADTTRQVAQKNMVNWVLANTYSSFGPKQEAETLDACIKDLKQLANQHHNAI